VLPSWHRAWGKPLFTASIRATPSDFVVDEVLGIDFTGEGEHDYLKIRKTGANTHWVAERLARHAGARHVDVGYSGRKDRHAVSTQWFSVAARGTVDWTSYEDEGVEILDVCRHSRKLRRGTHRGNRFRIAMRPANLDASPREIDARFRQLASGGVPNYFGAQRFGRAAANLDLARRVFAGHRLNRNRQNLAVSAARSFLFNEILSARVAGHTWNRVLSGEIANLDGSGSVFRVDAADATIERRCAEMDIHPTGALYGTGDDGPGGAVAAIEVEAVSPHGDITEGLERRNVEASRRPLRLRIGDLDWQLEDDAFWLEFSLPKGGFATSVLREVASVVDRSG
jgi:tRNA pseudouridine13 synthase